VSVGGRGETPERVRVLRTRAAVTLGAGLLVSLAHAPAGGGRCDAPRPVYASGGALEGVACGRGDAHMLTGPERLLFGVRLDLNASSPEALEVLPRIGEQRARALAAARPFADMASLEHVAGIGPVTARAVAAWSCVDASDCERPLAADWLEPGPGDRPDAGEGAAR